MPASVTAPPQSTSSFSSKSLSTFASLRDMSFEKSSQDGPPKSGANRRNSVRGLFGGDASVSIEKLASHQAQGNGDPAKASDGLWSISVAEAKDKDSRDSRKRKAAQTIYTLYITTPTHNLTLSRSVPEILELNTKLRQSANLSVPALPDLPNTTPQTSGRKFFQTISRTLSPVAGRSRGTSSNSHGDPSSPNDGVSLQPHLLSPPPSAPLTPISDDVAHAASHSTTVQLATYFTAIANMTSVRDHKMWKRFLRVGSDDYQSVRVERRVRKVRSDLAEHVSSSMAPRNVNVGEAPSHSDLDDDGGRTEDDFDSADDSSRGLHPTKARKKGPSSHSVEDLSSGKSDERRPSINNIEMIPEETQHEALEEGHSEAEDKHQRSERSLRRRKKGQNKVTVDDFEMIRVLGKGCAGKVLLVRHSATKGLYAMKSIHKRHVLAHQELQHTLTEQSVLKRMAKEVLGPFVVRLWWSFHDRNNLYLVMDFHPGGDLATQLSRWGRLGRDRARFYAAEILEGVEGLHKAGVIYRDLKPENVLIGADGHIVLSDFGLSKEFDSQQHSIGSSTPPPTSPGRATRSSRILSACDDAAVSRSASSNAWLDEHQTTTTFCGTAEYLAPEVLQGQPYSYEVDWWSFGTMLYEMLTGITPFWADTHADMYARVLRDPLVFPDDRVLDQDTKSILRGLLQRNPTLRMKEPRIKKHPYFSMIEWDHIFHKRYIPPYIPPIDPDNEIDTQNFDEAFLEMQPTVAHEVDSVTAEAATADTEPKTAGSPAQDESTVHTADTDRAGDDMDVDEKQTAEQSHLFDGYSFRGRKDSESVKSIISQREAGPPVESIDADVVTKKDSTTLAATDAADDMMIDTTTTAPQQTAPVLVATEEEDDETTARDAVAALAHLEYEADMEAGLSNASKRNDSSHAASDSEHSSIGQTQSSPASSYSSNKAASKVAPSTTGRPSNGAIREIVDEDEDWDMIDGPGDELQSEINGGKGANLFARGVVDTYRLLRRQESVRLPNSMSHSSTSSRPFHRLGKRRNEPGSGSMRLRPSRSTFASGSAQSLDSRSGAGPTITEAPAAESEGMAPSESKLSASSTGNRLSASSLSPGFDVHHRSAGSPSLSGSEENKHQARMKKIKRFTTFFESSSHR